MTQSMLLTIDVGNTQSVFALSKQGRIVHQWRMATDVRRSSDEYGMMMRHMVEHAGLSLTDIARVIVSSVVPDMHHVLSKMSADYLQKPMERIGLHGLNVPMKIALDLPREIGSDRLVGAYAAARHYPNQGIIIVDFGTATTFDVVTRDGVYQGGVIAPGVKLSLRALQEATAQLPTVVIRAPESQKVTGKNTVHAMQSGLYYGYLAMVDGLIARLKQEHKIDKVVATGGLAELYAHESMAIEKVMPDLILEGLMAIAEEKTQ